MSIIPVEQLTEIVRKTRAVFENSSLVSSVHQKGPIDFVTDADMQVQALLSAELSALCPDIQFMGEEKDNSEIDRDGTLWILDPIDGTTNLIHHFCHSTVSLALASHRTVLAAIVYNPYTDELFSAEKGKGAFLKRRARSRQPERYAAAECDLYGHFPLLPRIRRLDFRKSP